MFRDVAAAFANNHHPNNCISVACDIPGLALRARPREHPRVFELKSVLKHVVVPQVQTQNVAHRKIGIYVHFIRTKRTVYNYWLDKVNANVKNVVSA